MLGRISDVGLAANGFGSELNKMRLRNMMTFADAFNFVKITPIKT